MTDVRYKQCILIVDDEKVIADTLALILNAIGYESKAVYSGEAALETAERFKPDILISDVIMGGINGLELAILVSKRHPNCKIILFSGQASTADLIAQTGPQGQMFEVLAKPVRPQILIEHVKRLAPPANA